MQPRKRPGGDPIGSPNSKAPRTTLLPPGPVPNAPLCVPSERHAAVSLLPASPPRQSPCPTQPVGTALGRTELQSLPHLSTHSTPAAASSAPDCPAPTSAALPIGSPNASVWPAPAEVPFRSISLRVDEEDGAPTLPASLLTGSSSLLLERGTATANCFYEDTDSPRSTPPTYLPQPSRLTGRCSEWGRMSDDGASSPDLLLTNGESHRGDLSDFQHPPGPHPRAPDGAHGAGTPLDTSPAPWSGAAASTVDEAGPFYGLPDAVRGLLARHHGVTELYPWQQTVLRAMQRHQSYLFSLPTSSGKTLVAEMALLRSLLVRRRSAMLVLPFISLAEEKREGLEPFGAALGFAVHGYYGVNGRFPVPQVPGLLVCTIEKGNSVLNHLAEEKRLTALGTVVVDELHMVGEEGRGATLEMLLTKLRFACPDVQVVGMSATVPNLHQLADWLGAGCFEHNHRPVPLKEFVKVDQQVLDLEGNCVRTVSATADDPSGLLPLICEVCPQSSLLVFCATKMNCQECALTICRQLPPHFREYHGEERAQLLQDLRSCSDVADPTLQQTVPYGVAYHHSGLTMEERELLERAFRQHSLAVLCCTSTLAAGVNLPAKRVIFRTPYVGRTFLSKSQYMQMAGRAGRKGCDPYGESFLLLQPKEQVAGWALVHSGLEPCTSQLAAGLDATSATSPTALQKCVIETVASGLVRSRADLQRFVASTLSFHQAQDGQCRALLDAFSHTLNVLMDAKLIEEERLGDAPASASEGAAEQMAGAKEPEGNQSAELAGGALRATPFGTSAYKANFSIKEASFARTEFERLLDCGLILSDELHLCYLVTPFRDLVTPDWALFLALYHQMSATRQRISQMIGISERLLLSRSVGQQPTKVLPQPDKVAREELVLKRFFAALVLCDVVSELPMARVELKYKLNRGTIQALLKAAQVFANMMVNFSNTMGWYSLERVLAGYVKRLGFGVKPDLVPLTEIKGVQAARARALWNAGFRQVKDIAKVDVETLLLRLRLKCKSTRMLSRRAAQQIIGSARALLQAQAKELQEEAKELLAPE
eukprot:GGOE01015155.1.p1 GENE.GGOE01015155.1~~GGOE01015155.1.p1  ORF type:complete len:1052 (+),score=236.16 GGOE01015155.1:75-3230(+)